MNVIIVKTKLYNLIITQRNNSPSQFSKTCQKAAGSEVLVYHDMT